jgi:hypothetical protein
MVKLIAVFSTALQNTPKAEFVLTEMKGDVTVKKLMMQEPRSELPNILEYGTAKTGLQTTKLFFTENGKSKKMVRK